MNLLLRLILCLILSSPLLLASLVVGQSPALVGYWHNWDDASAPYMELDQIDPRYNVIEVAFAEPMSGTTYDMRFTPSGTPQSTFTDQVAAHRAAGRKVLISLGGANATVHLNNDTERDQFVASMMGILNTNGFDGIDIDLEGSSVAITGGTIAAPTDPAILRLIEAVEEIMLQYRAGTGEKLFLTMAPETAFVQGGQGAFGGIWGAYLPIINALRDSLDILQVQLYNSGSMFGIDGGIYEQGTADFIVSQTEAVIQGFNTAGGFFEGLPPENVAVALPACADAAGGGYTDTSTVRAAIEYLMGEGPQPGSYTLAQPGGYPALRGMMTWSINWDAVGACDGTNSYADNYEHIFGDASTGMDPVRMVPLSIFPNPAREKLFISGAFQGPVVVRDLTGRIVWQGTALNGAIDLGGLADGPYSIQVHGTRSYLGRFIKN